METNGLSAETQPNAPSTPYRELLITCNGAVESNGQYSAAAAPAGAGGFRFGDSESVVASTCRDQGFQTARVDGELVCQGINPAVGLGGLTYLTFCDGKLCTVDMVAPLPQASDAQILRQWLRIRTRIRDRYGSPFEEHLKNPPNCNDRLRECVARGEATLQFRWRWSSSHEVRLAMMSNAGDAVVRLIYSMPAASQGAPAL